jgi:hypothetical protein
VVSNVVEVQSVRPPSLHSYMQVEISSGDQNTVQALDTPKPPEAEATSEADHPIN